MKITILSLALLLFVALGASAQDSSDLKGPAYKNRKVWENPKPATTLTMKDGETKKGAGVKLMLPLERKTGELRTVTLEANKNTLKGPAYKNRKVWQKESQAKDTADELLAKD